MQIRTSWKMLVVWLCVTTAYHTFQGGVIIWQLSPAVFTVKKRGGASIWQVCPLRVCARGASLSQLSRLANGHTSQSDRKKKKKKRGREKKQEPQIFRVSLQCSRRYSYVVCFDTIKVAVSVAEQKLMRLASPSCLFWPGKIPRLASSANSASSGFSQHHLTWSGC